MAGSAWCSTAYKSILSLTKIVVSCFRLNLLRYCALACAIRAGRHSSGRWGVRRQDLWLVMMTNLNYVDVVTNYYFK